METHSQRQFTAAAQRVLDEAARWSGGDDSDGLAAPSLLLGLLAEAECRAAIMLARHGITPADVRERWPDLAPVESPVPPRRLSADVEESLSAAVSRLHEYPQPLDLATEHLLLGLAAAEHEAGQWLRGKGVDPGSLELEIHQQYRHTAGPLPVEAAEPLEVPSDAELDRVLEEAAAEAHAQPGRREPAPPAARPSDEIRVLRVLDAAANRAREGLRVVEDYVRFVLDDRHLTEKLKGLRHELTALVGRIALGDRLAARETQADVGTGVSTDAERRREDTAGVLAANFTRLQEAMRSLEEFGKLVDSDLAGRFESLRYQSYTLQRAVEITETSAKRLAAARLYVLVDGGSSAEAFEELAWSLVEAGVGVVQLRDKWLDDRQLYERARLLRQITRGSDTLFIVNDRPDLAALVHADGVHVGQEELSVKDARTIVGPAALVGVSTHSIEQARRAVLDGANYIGVGPTFPSETKEFDQFPGLPLLKAVAEEIRLPAFAIGGITPKNLPQVLAAGFTRVAVSRAVTAAVDPAAVARTFLAGLSRSG
jgi:thiamine-phosphate pyrophosphorylase